MKVTPLHDRIIVEGMQFDRGYISPYFVTDAEKMEVQLDDIWSKLSFSHSSSASPSST